MKKPRIDWEQVRSRLQASEAALEETLAESPQRIAAVYHARAVLLAQGAAHARPVSDGVPILVFSVARERYAIELHELAEVLPFVGCTPVPGSPPHFRGVMSERGELRAVADLGRMLAPQEGGSDSGFVLRLRRPGREIGLKVDQIEALSEFRAEDLRPGPRGNYVRAMASGGLLLLDLGRVLEELYSVEGSSTI